MKLKIIDEKLITRVNEFKITGNKEKNYTWTHNDKCLFQNVMNWIWDDGNVTNDHN